MIGRAIIFKIEVIFVFVIIGYAVFRLMMIRLFLLYSQVGYLVFSFLSLDKTNKTEIKWLMSSQDHSPLISAYGYCLSGVNWRGRGSGREYAGEVTECGGDHTVVSADPADAWIGILSRQYRIVKLALRLKWRHIIVIVIACVCK